MALTHHQGKKEKLHIMHPTELVSYFYSMTGAKQDSKTLRYK
jgi:hypothetical protein